jgi:branched-chain amino acid transport system permease protein
MSAPQAHMETLPRSVQALLSIGLMALLAFPFAGQDFYTQMVTRMMILAIFSMSLDLLQGITGLVSLGHAAYFGLAGYVLAFLSPADTGASWAISLPLAILGAALVALVIGCLVVRTHGIYFIMVTMAFSQMVYFLFFDNKGLGGSDGLYINVRPVALGLDMENKQVLYYFTLVCLVLVYRILTSPVGQSLWQNFERHSTRMNTVPKPWAMTVSVTN